MTNDKCPNDAQQLTNDQHLITTPFSFQLNNVPLTNRSDENNL